MRTTPTTSLALAVALGLALTGCASEAGPASNTVESDSTAGTESTSSPEAAEPVDLTGEWAQSNKGSGSKHVATIVDDTITVYWVNAEDESKSLYWAGSIEQPEDATAVFTWDSVNDKSKTGSALLASSDDQKTFSLDGDTISYEASALGETWTVELEQTSTTPAAAPADDQDTTGEYDVTIEGATFAKDYAGEPAIVVSYEFTNNSDEAANFMTAIHDQAFQSGVELESAIVEDVDTALSMSDIKPGTTVTIQEAYALRDESTVSVEVRELFSFSEAVLTSEEFSVKQ
jgi:hypothetical protein